MHDTVATYSVQFFLLHATNYDKFFQRPHNRQQKTNNLQIIAEAYSDNEKGVQTNPALQTVQIAEEMHGTDIVGFCNQQDHRAARF